MTLFAHWEKTKISGQTHFKILIKNSGAKKQNGAIYAMYFFIMCRPCLKFSCLLLFLFNGVKIKKT